MSVVLFVREDLLKASHYKRITVPGHVKRGKWIDSYSKNVLVADDHEDIKVAAGHGSFYQKQAHKKLAAEVDGFSSMDHGAAAALVLSQATKMQQKASESAALSGFKASMLAGKVPTTSQYLAMQNAPSSTQGKVADACAAAIGEEKYTKLLFAASAKANQTKGKANEPKTPEAVKTGQKEQTPAAAAGAASPAVNPAKPAEVGQPGTPGQAALGDDLPPKVKLQLDDWATDGYVDRLQDAADDHSSNPAYQAYAKKLLVQFQPIQAAVAQEPAFGPTASTPVPENIKAVIDKVASMPTGDLQGAKLLLSQVVANNAHNPHIAAYAQTKLGELSKIPASPPKSAIPLHTFTGDGLESYVSHGTGKMAGQFSVTLKDTDSGQFVPSATFYPSEDAAIKSAKAAAGVKDDLKEGDTKPGADGSNLVFKNGRWHKYVNADEHGELPPVLVPVADDAANTHASDAALVAAMEGGSYYQKEAVKKLKAEHGPAWAAMHPTQQLELTKAKYQALQGAASQAAAVSGWKKHMLAGQVPTPSEVKAMAAFDTATPDKAVKVMNEVQAAIGLDKYVQLVTQAHAKAAKAPASAPAAKVFVTTPPPVAAPVPAPAPVAPAAPAAPVPVVSQVFNNTQPGHNKFWSVSTHGTVMKTTYGKIGTQGSTTTKVFNSPGDAIAAKVKLMDEKVAKGYKYGGNGTHSHEAVSAAGKPAPVAAVEAIPADPMAQVKAEFDKIAANGDFDTLQAIMNVGGLKPEVKDYLAGLIAAAGPKDGDTKQGADGTLVFKDGHWHKVKIQKMTQKAVNGLLLAEFGMAMNTNSAGKKALKAMAAGDAPGMVEAHKNALSVGYNSTAKKIKFLADKMGVSVDGSPVAPSASKSAVFTTDPAAIAAALQGGVKSAKPTVSAPTVKVVAGKPPVTVIDGWAQTGKQAGSNPGGKFKDKSGQEWYCKFPSDIDVAMNELLAAKFYQMLGVSVPILKLVEQGGKVGIASKWVDGMSVGTAAQLAKAPGAHQAFALDAWLANWDVVGMSNDNLMLDKKGAAVRVDVGGSLVYRAMGGKKGEAFGDTVPELDTLKDAKTNDKAAAVFGKVKDADMAWGLGQLNKMKPSQIEELCQKVGPGSDADKAALAKKLIARRAFILAKMGVRDQWTHVKALDPTKLPVNQSDFPKPIQFKASSKEHVNAQNTKDSEALIAFASKGNLTALKDYMYDAVDKETSAPLGKKSILDHPSKPLKEQWAGLVELLQSISTPPMPTLELPSLGSIGDLEDISEFVGTFSPEARVETVASEHRMHFFMALSHIDDISGLVADMKWSFLKSAGKFVQEAKAKHSSLSAQVKGYISAVQSSGSINHSWSQGKTTVSTGAGSVGIHGLTAKIYAEAQELPEGTTLIRGMSDTSSGKSMCKQLLACAPGTVIQNTDSMCASYNESHSWGGDVQMTIRCAKGCKATLSFATGKYGGEHEITTLPGQRYVVLSTKKVNDTVHLEVLMLPPHEGFVSELANLSALGKAMSVIFVRGR